ncbi:hypothetical protein [Acrocarpospora macrocephala]|uniref:hypothetical protein n=1 Tax=Acrocarpospora macrocephala TaxID=150177 RepID=UPI0012D33023|nr:hypothetical protein [Acrocarpospora macrocephala]
MGGVLSTVAAGILVAWMPTGGRDLIDRMTNADPLPLLRVTEDLEGAVALDRPIDDADDRAALLTDPDSFPRLVAKYGGATVGRVDVSIVAEGGRGRVRVVDIRPRIARKLPALDDSYFLPGSGGEPAVISMTSYLDRPDIRFHLPGKAGGLYFSAKHIEIARGEQVGLLLTFEAKKAYYEFDIVVTVLADGREYQKIINRKDGTKFRVTGVAADYRRFYEGDGSTWYPMRKGGKCRIFTKSKGC